MEINLPQKTKTMIDRMTTVPNGLREHGGIPAVIVVI